MMTLCCISTDGHCNCLVLLQPYRITLLLLEIIATVFLGCNISHDHCNRYRPCIATKFPRRCNSLFLLPQFWFVVIFITTIAIARPCIVIKFPRRCNSLLLLPQFYFVVIFIMTIAIGSCLIQLMQ
jgi:hypothetical protein